MWKRVISLMAIVSLFLICAPISALNTHKFVQYKLKTVVIDAGHGGRDPGTSGKFTKEKDITLAVALKLGKTIQEHLPDVKVIYTRTKDEFVELHKRASIANENKADLFISIHCNAIDASPAKRAEVSGTEVYVMGVHKTEENLAVAKRENAVIYLEEGYEEIYEGFDPNSPQSHIMMSIYSTAYLENSLRFAQLLDYQFRERANRPSRGIKQAGFMVLHRSAMPSVLIEIGYLSNPEEEKFLNDPWGQTLIASAIFRAFRDYKKELESL